METEAEVGARWWANCLRQPEEIEHDAGDIGVDAMANWARDQDSRNDSFDAAKVDEFEKCVAERLQELIDDRRTWDYQQPYIGSTVISCDYHAHPILQESADAVGLEISSMTTFPVKTTMWLNPGEVRVSNGYSDGIETIWEIGEHRAEIADRVSGWVWTTEHPERGTVFEPEPKVFPTDDGYIIRAYGEYDPAVYGPASRDFMLAADDIETDGLDTVLGRVKREVDDWRAESAGGSTDD